MTAKDLAAEINDTKPEWAKRATKNQLATFLRSRGLNIDANALLTELRKLRRTGPLCGDALAKQQAASLAGVLQSQAYQKRMEARADRLTMAENDTAVIHSMLIQAGATLDQTSPSGSRYYTLNGSPVRVSDHPANEATSQWLDRAGGQTIDLGCRNPMDRLAYILEREKEIV